MKFAHLEKDTNKLLGWYDDNIHSKIPTPNIEVSDEVWQDAININANCYENKKFIIKDFRTEEEVAEQELQAKVNKALNYLSSTDWYVERLNDPSSGKAIPEEILAKRAEARLILDEKAK